ncbi:MAG: EamA family transporter [Microthrixaceae bacterium]
MSGPALATLLALTSAALHATWNVLLKTSEDREAASLAQFLFGALFALPFPLLMGWPPAAAAPSMVASSLIHIVYVTGLVKAYQHGDFSLTYPLARGGGALLAAIGGVVLLGDRIGAGSWLALCVVTLGLASLVWTPGSGGQVWKGLPGAGRPAGRMVVMVHPDRAALGWAAVTAAAIAAYTLADSRGSRLSDTGAPYGITVMVALGAAVVGSGLLRGRGPRLAAHLRTSWHRAVLAGLFLDAAYALVLIAVRHAPVGQVAMLREASVVMGAGIGWIVLHERMGAARVRSSLVITLGLVLLVVASG